MLVSLNGNLAGFRILPSPRISGEAHLFVGDPFYPAANAMLSNFKLTDLAASPSLLTAPLTKLANTVLRPEYYGKVTVPVNYSLRFNIRPTQVIPTWGSIIHYSIDGADMGSRGSRMPAIFTHPGSLNLHVRVDGNTYLNAGIDTTVQLPLNAMTAVRLEAVGQSLQLFYNNTMVGSVQLASPRISGEAHLFASDFFYEPTRGTIQSLELVAK
jgi:hypothetical protein